MAGLSHYQRSQLLDQGYSNAEIDRYERDLETQGSHEVNRRWGNDSTSWADADRAKREAGYTDKQPQRRRRAEISAPPARSSGISALQEALAGEMAYMPPDQRPETESERNLRVWKEQQAAEKAQAQGIPLTDAMQQVEAAFAERARVQRIPLKDRRLQAYREEQEKKNEGKTKAQRRAESKRVLMKTMSEAEAEAWLDARGR